MLCNTFSQAAKFANTVINITVTKKVLLINACQGGDRLDNRLVMISINTIRRTQRFAKKLWINASGPIKNGSGRRMGQENSVKRKRSNGWPQKLKRQSEIMNWIDIVRADRVSAHIDRCARMMGVLKK